MKILSDAESAGIKLIIAILVITLVVVCFWKTPKNNYTVAPTYEKPEIVHDTVWEHDTIVEVHPITRTITVHDTVYINN